MFLIQVFCEVKRGFAEVLRFLQKNEVSLLQNSCDSVTILKIQHLFHCIIDTNINSYLPFYF
jgi:hypothetical protein